MLRSSRLLSLVALLLLAACAAPVPPVAAQAAGTPNDMAFQHAKLAIETKDGRHSFDVELALTPDQQARGLMFRREMAADAGMLFIYPGTSRISMWMANTLLPLDMLFIAPDGTITRIVERTVPLSRDTISSGGFIKAVLELNAGTASRLGIKRGDKVIYEAFGTE